MAKEVRIHLTPAQKAKIKSATGKTMAEIRVSPVGKSLSAKFTARQQPVLSAKVAAKVSTRPAARALTAKQAARIAARQASRIAARR
jgi:hypothetical protein